MSKTNKGLVEYAIAQLGKPYWWGTFGQVANAGLYYAKKAQYPSYYTATDFTSQYGQKVHDCVGLIKGYLWCDYPDSVPIYNGSQDVAVNGMYQNCSEKGPILTMPDVPGVCVFNESMGHVGVYIGNGQVVEAMGHAYGVVKTSLKSRGWAYWGKPKWIEYDDSATVSTGDNSTPVATTSAAATKTCTVELPVLSNGSQGGTVKAAQTLLMMHGVKLPAYGADSDFGDETETGVKEYQTAKGLEVDGIVGAETWASLLK